MAQFEEVGVKAIVKGYDKFIFQIGSMGKSIGGLNSAGVAASSGLSIATVAIGAVAAAAVAAVAVIGAISAALFALGKDSIETANSFETAFAGILKTTNGLGTNMYDLTDAGEAVLQQFRDLAKEIPLSFEELSKIGEFAGQLGIPEQALANFTRTVAALGVSTELSTEQAALGLARIANVYGISADDMASNTERMGSTLAYLGNNFAAMEDEILIFARNIAGTTSALGITQDQLFAIGTAFTAAGNTAEAGGSSVQRVLLEMSKAVAAGGDDLKAWAEATGLSAQEFADQWGSEGGPARVFLAFMQSLAAEGEGASQVLADLDVDTIRVIRTMLSAAGSVDILEQALDGASQAWENNTALTREASIRYNTMDSQMAMITNRFRDMKATIGQQLIPAFMPLINDVLKPFIQGLEQGLPFALAYIIPAIENDFVPALKNLAAAFGLDTPSNVAEGIQMIGKAISENIVRFSNFINGMIEFRDTIKEMFSSSFFGVITNFGIDAPFEDFFSPEMAEVAYAVVGAFKKVRNAAIDVGEELIPILKLLFSTIKDIFTGDEFASFATRIGEIFEFIIDVVLYSWNNVIAPILALIIPVLGEVIKGLMAVFGADSWEEAGAAIQTMFDNIGAIVSSWWADMGEAAFNTIKEDIIWVWNIISTWLGEQWDKLTEKWNGFWDGIRENAQNKAQEIRQNIINWINGILEEWGITDEIKARWRAIWDDVKLIAAELYNRIVQPVIDDFTKLKDNLSQKWDEITTKVSETWEAIKQKIEEKFGPIIDKINGFIQDILSAFTNKWQEFVNIGRNLIEGMKEGVRQKAGELIESVTSAVENALDWVKQQLGIQSPSKEGMKIGSYFIEGIAGGILGSMGLLEGA
ncbi:phage tail tape measure protein, partial [Candidatus Bathyarchaeota archaeon]